MNIENTRRDYPSLGTKAEWRRWVQKQAQVSSAFASVSYLEEFLKHCAPANSIWGGFQSLSPEPSISWEQILPSQNLQWAFPKVVSDTAIEFYQAQSFKPHPKFGMLEPDLTNAQPVSSEAMAGVLVPGLAFDNRGFRLGRGKGYYDRFLKDFKGLKVGLCSHKLFVLGPLPKDSWDVEMDYIITDEFIFKAE